MKIIESLKKRNRTVLEMELGILFCGVLCQAAGALLATRQGDYAVSLWFGILLSVAALHHMYRTLDRALDLGEGQAEKWIFRGYIIRYCVLVALIMAIIYTGVMNPLIVFMACMSLKVTAYLQPFTHKLCNKIFHETDPVPEPLVEEEKQF
ncbi:MAG: ATP synthase subunit I [Roseburia sp.]|nr:ATP synthase subunit I [Roseburia sp.]